MAKILIVDDSAIMRRNIRAILEGAGHEVVAEAEDGREAIQLYFATYPDLVTMDIAMPEMQGIEALREIIARDPGAKVVMISSLAQKKMVLDAIDFGAKHYIIKPITTDNVLNVVSKFVNEPKVKPQAKREDYSFKNEGGMFKVSFFAGFTAEKVAEVEKAIRGLYIFSPFVVKFDFSELEKIEASLYIQLRGIMNEVKEQQSRVLFSFGNNPPPEFFSDFL